MQLQDHSVCCIPHFLVGGCVGFLLIVTAIATGIDIWRNDCNKTKQRKRKQSKAKKTNVPWTNKHAANRQSKANKGSCCCNITRTSIPKQSKGSCCCCCSSLQCGSTRSKTIKTNNQLTNTQQKKKKKKRNKQRKLLLQHNANTHTKQTTYSKQTKQKTKQKRWTCCQFLQRLRGAATFSLRLSEFPPHFVFFFCRATRRLYLYLALRHQY